MLVLAGCAPQVAPSATDPAPAQAQMAQGEPRGEAKNCHEFTVQLLVGGQPQQAVGQACQQPDGSWRITQNTAGLPEQVYMLPPQAIYLYPYPEPYYWWDPWFYGSSFFVGGPVFLGNRFHRFHHHGGFHQSSFSHGHGGFHGGRR